MSAYGRKQTISDQINKVGSPMILKALVAFSAFAVLGGPACAQNPPTSGRVVTIAGCPSHCTIPLPGNDLVDLVRQVAANSGMEFIIDPRVNASVEYAGDTLTENITYATLLAILRIHGYVAVEIGGVVSIVLDANARTMPTRILQSDDPSVSDHEVVSRVISLSADAAGLVPILRPLVPQYGHLAAFGNSLIVVDRYDNVRRLTELAHSLSGQSSTASE